MHLGQRRPAVQRDRRQRQHRRDACKGRRFAWVIGTVSPPSVRIWIVEIETLTQPHSIGGGLAVEEEADPAENHEEGAGQVDLPCPGQHSTI